MKSPSMQEVVELNVQELETKLDMIEQQLGQETAKPFRLLLGSVACIQQILASKDASLHRLRKMIFGARTERTSELTDTDTDTDTDDTGDQNQDDANGQDASQTPTQPSDTSPDDQTAGKSTNKSKRRRGHGRIPASAYTGCEQVQLKHETFTDGDGCPHCGQGTLYQFGQWSQVVRLVGQAPIGGTRYELQRLRCHVCGEVETAQLPESAGEEKFDPSVASTLALLHYGNGMPFNRLEKIQQAAGVPLPASTQWEVLRDAIRKGLMAVYEQLLDEAAQGTLVHNDDTTMRVLELSQRKKAGEPMREDDPDRSGVFTTGILSIADGRPDIALFMTGPSHAGENLRELLQRRLENLPPPIQMCDGLSRNLPKDIQTELACCMSHGRRKFFELHGSFKDPVVHVLSELAQVYHADDFCKRYELSPAQRLAFHRRHSDPVLKRLHRWLDEQIDNKHVEPNSELGKAIKYMLNHWQELTLFVRQEGVPLDNNICERALKLAIRHRKNSYFYKTMRGAAVGDLYMSLIHTCQHAQVDPRDYLTQLQRHHEQVIDSPEQWLPWTYRQTLQQLQSSQPAESLATAD